VLKTWVRRGGQLFFMTGEGEFFWSLLSDTFQTSWRFGSYRGEEHQLGANAAQIVSSPVRGELPPSYHTKAIWLKGVPPDERLYVPPAYEREEYSDDEYDPQTVEQEPQCGVAVHHVGDGRVVYLGDVNGQDASMQVLRALTKDKFIEMQMEALQAGELSASA
jgi:hypothetical protein